MTKIQQYVSLIKNINNIYLTFNIEYSKKSKIILLKKKIQ